MRFGYGGQCRRAPSPGLDARAGKGCKVTPPGDAQVRLSLPVKSTSKIIIFIIREVRGTRALERKKNLPPKDGGLPLLWP